VIQVNIRAGEFAASSPKAPAIIVGETGRLQVRADVDEQNATRIRPGQRAVAFLKGDREVAIPLEFVRIEPFVIPKVSLTGASTERVDTRVLADDLLAQQTGRPTSLRRATGRCLYRSPGLLRLRPA